jgi:hypothetical protein
LSFILSRPSAYNGNERNNEEKVQSQEVPSLKMHYSSRTVSSPTFWKEQILNLIQKNTQLQLICCHKKNGAY